MSCHCRDRNSTTTMRRTYVLRAIFSPNPRGRDKQWHKLYYVHKPTRRPPASSSSSRVAASSAGLQCGGSACLQVQLDAPLTLSESIFVGFFRQQCNMHHSPGPHASSRYGFVNVTTARTWGTYFGHQDVVSVVTWELVLE